MRKPPWNKGLTKKDDPRIAKQAEWKSEWWRTADTSNLRSSVSASNKKRETPNGSAHHGWKSGKYTNRGYLYSWVENHPNAVRRKGKTSGPGHVMEHRLVMEKELGRYLTPNEEVHHKNGVKDDNRITNLELVVKTAHFGKVLCPHCLTEFKIK